MFYISNMNFEFQATTSRKWMGIPLSLRTCVGTSSLSTTKGRSCLVWACFRSNARLKHHHWMFCIPQMLVSKEMKPHTLWKHHSPNIHICNWINFRDHFTQPIGGFWQAFHDCLSGMINTHTVKTITPIADAGCNYPSHWFSLCQVPNLIIHEFLIKGNICIIIIPYD